MAKFDYNYEELLPKSFVKRSELIKQRPDILLYFGDSLLMCDEEKFKQYKENNIIEVNVNGKTKKISLDLIKDIISEEAMFKYLITSFNRDYDTAISIYNYSKELNNTDGTNGSFMLSEDDDSDWIKITKPELVLALRHLDPSIINSTLSLRMVLIYTATNQTACLNRYSNYYYDCVIDNKTYTISANELIKILISNKREYKDFINGRSNLPFDKDIIAYMIVDFCETENLLNKYYFDEKVYNRYIELKNYKTVDYEYLNKNKKSDDILSDGSSILDQFEINSELYNALYDGIDPKYNELEQAIYIYIRLCDLLTYDDEHFISSNNYEKAGYHSDISNISNINLKNNKVVSFEFILIYAKILRDLKIKYSLNINSIAGYVEEKSSMKFRHGEYLVIVDLFKNIIKNDMTMVKIGGTISSMRSYNTNEVTHKKFEELVYNIYIAYKDTLKRRKEFLDNVRDYKINYYKDTASKKDKLYILFKIIGRKDLKGIDSINYINEVLWRIVGEDDTITFNIYATVNESPSPIVVINYNNGVDDYYYMIDISSNNRVSICSYEYLKSLIDSEKLLLIDKNRVISEKEGAKYVK